jgi:hypothetical protein
MNAHIEDSQAAVVHNALEEAARSVPEPLGQVDMVQEDIVVGAQGLVAVLEEEAPAAEAADRHFSHLLEAQEVHEETLGCSIVQNHVHQLVDMMDVERAVLQCQPCFQVIL